MAAIMTTVHINLGERSYDVAISSGDQPGLGPFARARSRGTLALVVADENVVAHADAAAASLSAAGFRTSVKVVAAGETSKSLDVAARLYDRLAELNADRKTLVVAVGGGVVGDLAGFVAATYNRGLALLMVPTTLLSMVDSAVGGKVGVNHPRGKNLIGAFHQPAGVWIDTEVLETLPGREYRSGLAEVVKYGVILDPDLFSYLEKNGEAVLRQEAEAVGHVVARSCRLKADVVEKDERELTGLRAILNYGHTFAHAFETVAGYGAWLHGEAVAAGMVCASRLAERRGLIPGVVTARQIELLEALGLPIAPEAWSIDQLLAVMRNDKKNEAGRLRFVLPRRLGEVALFHDVPEEDVRAVLSETT
jgi:3-dehydroquinate synthase